MKSAPKHPQEKERQEALDRLNLLDTLPEQDFDELTLIASQICNTPVALMSLVDASRQWFKSKQGIDAIETPRDLAFCAHAILNKDVLIVPDATLDSRFKDNPMVTGGPKVMFYAGAPLFSPEGLPIGTLCVIDYKPRNISPEQVKALQALSNQIQRIIELRVQVSQVKEYATALTYKKTAVDNLSEGVILIDASAKIIEFNEAAMKTLGLTADQLTGKKSLDPDWKMIREDGSVLPMPEHPSIFSLRTEQPLRNIIIGILRSNLELRWISVNATPLFLEGSKTPTHVINSFSDITDQKKLAEDRNRMSANLAESARLSLLGEMAGGIAHEINTPLSSILMLTSLLTKKILDKTVSEADLLSKIEKIQNTSQRIAKIVKGLKVFSRNSENDPQEEISVSTVIESTLDLCREKISQEQIELKLDIEKNLQVLGRSTEISQVLMNLLSNSLDAILPLPEKWIQIKVFQKESQVFIWVTDSGSGIPTMVVEKMMNPFFTTKEVGKGTGLGLSISNGIIEAHGGKLSYDQTCERTRFIIMLPVLKKNQQNKAA